MRVKSLLCLFLLLLMAGGIFAQVQAPSAYPKREFRAAWIQAVNGQFRGIPTETLKQTLINQLNSLQGRASMPSSSRCALRGMRSTHRNTNRGAAI